MTTLDDEINKVLRPVAGFAGEGISKFASGEDIPILSNVEAKVGGFVDSDIGQRSASAALNASLAKIFNGNIWGQLLAGGIGYGTKDFGLLNTKAGKAFAVGATAFALLDYAADFGTRLGIPGLGPGVESAVAWTTLIVGAGTLIYKGLQSHIDPQLAKFGQYLQNQAGQPSQNQASSHHPGMDPSLAPATG